MSDDEGVIVLRRKRQPKIDKCKFCKVAVRIDGETCNQHLVIGKVVDKKTIWKYICFDCIDDMPE